MRYPMNTQACLLLAFAALATALANPSPLSFVPGFEPGPLLTLDDVRHQAPSSFAADEWAPIPFSFADACGSHMVLQMAPAMAAVYGPVGNTSTDPSKPPSVEVTVSGSGSGSGFGSYTVQANLTLSDIERVFPESKLPAPNRTWLWKALLKPTAAGGNYTISAKCTAGCTGSAEIVDVTFGSVWLCSGQSNMALSLAHTFNRNKSRDAILKPGSKAADGIRMTGTKGNMNAKQPWITAGAAAAGDPQKNQLFSFSATCFYFAESMLERLGDKAPPIGLIHNAWGGSTVEEWTPISILRRCDWVKTKFPPPMEDDVWACGGSGWGGLWHFHAKAYADTTLAGWTWYQGENDSKQMKGNAAQKIGYGCQMTMLVSFWREIWSRVPGTTDPFAPFGIVSLASGTGEGSTDMGDMRWAQTANFGTLPGPAELNMTRTFLAHAYDLGEPWADPSCLTRGCCDVKPNATTCASKTSNNPDMCDAACAALTDTPSYMGSLHPRGKKPLGERLAVAVVNQFMGGSGAYAGPTLAGCTLDESAAKITIRFNTTLLRGNAVVVKPNPSAGNKTSMFVLVDGSFWCNDTVTEGVVLNCSGPANWTCADPNAPGQGKCDDALLQCGGGPLLGGRRGIAAPTAPWVQVPVTLPAPADGDAAAASVSSVEVDLSGLPKGAVPLAIRYAWGNDNGDTCCDLAAGADKATEPCSPGSCLIWDSAGELPANPFIAAITAEGKCQCIAPQLCDG